MLEGLNREEEVKEFYTVNGTQVGVPKALNVFLQGDEPARIAWNLNIADDSPFKNRITRTSMQKNHLFKLHSVAKQIDRSFNHGKLQDFDEEVKFELYSKYWNIIADEIDEPWSDIEKLDHPDSRGRQSFDYKLLELTGLIAWSLIAPEIFVRSYTDHIGMNWDHVKMLVNTCGVDLDWRKDGQYAGRTGEAGARVIFLDMQRKLPSFQEENDELD